MAGFRAVLAVAALTAGLGACALVEGLSHYRKESCAEGCGDDGGADSGLDAEDRPDEGADTAPDGADGGSPTVADASDSGSTVAESGDDTGGGCGPLTSVDHCGACDVQCNATTGTPSCTGATCTYVCTAGRSNCNATAPDTDGCECATPACCGSGCQTSHSDGVGDSYFDCNPPGTYSEMTAISACTAYALSVHGTAANCIGPLTCKGSPVPTICFASSGGTCANYCWQYTGVYADGGPGTVWDCACPAHLVGSWN